MMAEERWELTAKDKKMTGIEGMICKDPIVSKCNQSHVDIFRFIFINLFFFNLFMDGLV
jgi:hypothetical protein